MTPHHKETNFVSNQPVKFYKIIALSFIVLTVGLFAVIVFMSSKEATITITTKDESVNTNKNITIGVGGDHDGVVTSTIISLEKTFSPTGIKEEPGIARGIMTLHNDSAFDQALIATTRLMTPDGIIFRIKDRVLVPANGVINVEVYADKEGVSGNIGPVAKLTVPGLREETQKVVYASSDKSMTGGIKTIGVLGEADVKKAEVEFLANLEEQGKNLLSKLYPDKLAVFSTIQPVVENNGEVGKEVSEFILKGQATVIGVFYNESEIKTEISNLLNQRVVSDVENLAKEFDYTVTLDSYDLTAGTAVLKLFANGTAELDPTSKQLDKNMFFGKTKDEVRRYLLSLDHVQSVDISFKPAWMRTVPHVADHVQVIVKEVE